MLELLGQAGGGRGGTGIADRADGATDVGVAAEEELAQQELVGQGPLFELLEEAAAEVVSTEGPELAEALAVGAGAQTYLAEGSGGAEEVLQEKAGATELLQQDLPPDEDVTVAVEQQAVSAVPPGGDALEDLRPLRPRGARDAARGYREHGIVGKRAADELARLRGEGDEVSASHALSRTSALEALASEPAEGSDSGVRMDSGVTGGPVWSQFESFGEVQVGLEQRKGPPESRAARRFGATWGPRGAQTAHRERARKPRQQTVRRAGAATARHRERVRRDRLVRLRGARLCTAGQGGVARREQGVRR